VSTNRSEGNVSYFLAIGYFLGYIAHMFVNSGLKTGDRYPDNFMILPSLQRVGHLDKIANQSLGIFLNLKSLGLLNLKKRFSVA
jgi:hypothetical protein